MSNHIQAALHFEQIASQERRPEERERLLIAAREFRWLAIAEGRRYVRELPKRPSAPSARRNEKERKHG